MSDAYILAEMTWPEVKEALKRVKLAIVPIGSFEQHAPFMTFTVDTERAYGFSRLLAERLYPYVLVVPPIPFGISYHHMDYAGSITLRHETFQAVITDVVQSLCEHGIRQFFLANGHGGNNSSLDMLTVRLRRELGVQIAWGSQTALASEFTRSHVKPENSGHCGQDETSQTMYLAPHVVRKERIVPGSVKERFKKGRTIPGFNVPHQWSDYTDNGAVGDATLASEELGKEILEAALNRATELLKDFMGLTVAEETTSS